MVTEWAESSWYSTAAVCGLQESCSTISVTFYQMYVYKCNLYIHTPNSDWRSSQSEVFKAKKKNTQHGVGHQPSFLLPSCSSDVTTQTITCCSDTCWFEKRWRRSKFLSTGSCWLHLLFCFSSSVCLRHVRPFSDSSCCFLVNTRTMLWAAATRTVWKFRWSCCWTSLTDQMERILI